MFVCVGVNVRLRERGNQNLDWPVLKAHVFVRGTERDISLANEPSEIQDPADIFYREENDNSLIYFLLTYLDTYLSYLLIQYELELKNSISKIVQCISSFTTYICLKCG